MLILATLRGMFFFHFWHSQKVYAIPTCNNIWGLQHYLYCKATNGFPFYVLRDFPIPGITVIWVWSHLPPLVLCIIFTPIYHIIGYACPVLSINSTASDYLLQNLTTFSVIKSHHIFCNFRALLVNFSQLQFTSTMIMTSLILYLIAIPV